MDRRWKEALQVFAYDVIPDNKYRPTATDESIEYYTKMGACVRNKDTQPYESNPVLSKKLIAPNNKIPECIYGKWEVNQDFYGDER